MTQIFLRSGVGQPLTHTQVDSNFTNLKSDKTGTTTAADGGTETQNTSKSTGVTLNKICGTVTMNNASLASNGLVSFTLTNSTIAATDVIVLNHASGGTAGKYVLNAQAAAGSALITVSNISTGALSEAIVIRFIVVKATAG